MAHVTNFVPKLPILSNLHRMVSCPIFRPSNPLIGPKTQPYPPKYLPKPVFFLVPHPQRKGGLSLLPQIKGKIAKFPKTCQNAPCWHIKNPQEICCWVSGLSSSKPMVIYISREHQNSPKRDMRKMKDHTPLQRTPGLSSTTCPMPPCGTPMQHCAHTEHRKLRYSFILGSH